GLLLLARSVFYYCRAAKGRASIGRYPAPDPLPAMTAMLGPCLTLLRRALTPALLALALTPVGAATAKDKEPPIRIGEINSYKAIPAFLGPYKKGWQLAVEEVNAGGGVLGRKLEVISRDDNGNPGDSVRAAQELIAREKVELIFGGFLSNTG